LGYAANNRVSEDYKSELWLRNKYYEDELSMKEIADLCGVHECTVRHFMNKFSIKRRSGSSKLTKAFRERMSERLKGKPTWNHDMAGKYHKWTKRGSDAPGYKDGTTIYASRGYRMILKPEHPNTNANGYVFEHRLVCEELLGRYLTADEIVHHRDANRLNNDPSNLFIFYGHDIHFAFHKAKLRDTSLTEEEYCRGDDIVIL
jgi:predicted DNA-binding protein YlxM (UPF0122 family)